MKTKMTLNVEDKKIAIGYSILVFVIIPITLGTSQIIFLVLKERIFISKTFQKKLNKKLKKINLKKNLKDFFDLITTFYFFYIFFKRLFPKTFFFEKVFRYIFSNLGLFLYFKFGFILQVLIKSLEFVSKTSLGLILTTFVFQLNHYLINIMQYFHRLFKKLFNDADRLNFLLGLFEICCDIVIIVSGFLIWFSIFFEFLWINGSLHIFFKEMSSVFPGFSLKNIIVLPSRVVTALKIVIISSATKQKKEFLLCDTKIKKGLYISSRSMFYIVWICYICSFFKQSSNFRLRNA